MTSRFAPPARSQGGFTLIEALTALLVTAFGMLAIAGFQASLSQSSDIAKQRTEAVRLAQLKIEELRAFEQVAADGSKFDYATDVVSGADSISPTSGSYATNTSYARAWTVNGTATSPQKWIRVAVSWTDRLNTLQTVTLHTVIAQSDPASIGTLAVGPGVVTARSPKNRNVDIPYPAIMLANGMSAFQPGSDTNPNPNPFFVFDNLTGVVLGWCAYTVPITTGTSISFANDDGTGTTTTGCTKQKAYLLSGYIHFYSGGYNQNQVDNAFTDPAGATKSLQPDIIFVSPTTSATKQCYAQRQKVVRATGSITPVNIQSATRSSGVVTITTTGNHGMDANQYVAISDVTDDSFNGVFRITAKVSNTQFTYASAGANGTAPSGTITPKATLVQQFAVPEIYVQGTDYSSLYSNVVSRYVAYTCTVVPVDHDSDEGSAPTPTPRRWSGQFVIQPLSTAGAWSLGTTASTYKLCRYTGNYYPDTVLSNSEHPLYYRGVTGALDNQNYVVVDGNVSCPSDGPANTYAQPPDYWNSNTTRHQTIDASTCNGAHPCGGLLSGSNSGGAAGNGGIGSGFAESSDLSVALPMFKTGD